MRRAVVEGRSDEALEVLLRIRTPALRNVLDKLDKLLLRGERKSRRKLARIGIQTRRSTVVVYVRNVESRALSKHVRFVHDRRIVRNDEIRFQQSLRYVKGRSRSFLERMERPSHLDILAKKRVVPNASQLPEGMRRIVAFP